MIYLNTFLYYTLFSSVIVIYGIGLNRSVEIGISLFYKPVFYLKALFTIISSSVLSWLFTNYILMPLKLIELFPLIVPAAIAHIPSPFLSQPQQQWLCRNRFTEKMTNYFFTKPNLLLIYHNIFFLSTKNSIFSILIVYKKIRKPLIKMKFPHRLQIS